MSSRTLLIDAGLAVLAAALVLILAPGLAIVAIIAVLVLLVAAVSFGVRRRRTREPRRRRTQEPRRRQTRDSGGSSAGRRR